MSTPESTLEGNIGTDLERRAVGSQEVCSFRVLTNDRKQVNGEWQNVNTIGWNVEVWGDKNKIDNVMGRLEKGDPVIVPGRFVDDSYTNGEGERKIRMVFRANSIGLDVGRAKIRS